MKIRFPRIEYSFRIHPKPRGNWRPKVDMSLQISCPTGEELAWRPFVKGIWFITEKGKKELMKRQDEKFCPNSCSQCKYFSLSRRCCSLYRDDLLIIVPDWFWNRIQKGEGKSSHYFRVFDRGYYQADEAQEVNYQATFYLPWRPGKADYSDYAEAFAKVPEVLYEAFQEGLDSLESKPLSFEFKGTLKAKAIKEEKEEIKKEVVEFV